MKKRALVLISIMVVLITLLLIYTKSQSITGLTRVDSYRHYDEGEVVCDAMTPSCGLCIGKVIDRECYVDKTKLSPEELRYMGFE